jgi:MoaA/NifB/PqqE/SkfB family radical SAM enzyme
MSSAPDTQDMLWKEAIANRPRHWVRTVTACNSKCLFCLDMDTPRNVYLTEEEVQADLQKGRDELDAWKVILSGGEATIHPQFVDFIKYARKIGYGRVQTVTNGVRLGQDKDFLYECLDAGLDEITFSLHGHTPELHDHLTQTPKAFKHLMKAMIRAKRDGRAIVNVDIVINKQNVAHLDKIIDLCARVGVTEFDLLHVIPQSEAFRRRDDLFYNPRKYLPILHKVFRLNRHPRFVIWTNRFPIPFLEGMEDLIQDPHKMLDEINGRRFHVRKYLDRGVGLECREPDRCQHCFIEPYCNTMDKAISRQNEGTWDVWWGTPVPETLPYGIRYVGRAVDTINDAPDRPAYLRVNQPETAFPSHPSILVAHTAAHLEAWVGQIPEHIDVMIELNVETGPWMLDHRDALAAQLERVRIHQPTWEHMSEAVASDIRDPASFFRDLDLRIRVSGLPACSAPGVDIVDPVQVLRADMFDPGTGRFSIRELARYHVREGYFAKSTRCEDCTLTERCEGMHVNMIRDQGLRLLTPLSDGEWAEDAGEQLLRRYPIAPMTVASGKPLEPTAESLPGFGEAPEPPEDPLAIKEREMMAKKEARKAKAKARWAEMQAEGK